MKRIPTVGGPFLPHPAALLAAVLLGSLLALAGCGGEPSAKERLDKGKELAEQGDWPGAAAELEALLEKDPDNASALSMLGVVYYHLERLEEAIAHYQRALELEPERADIHSNLAAAYVQEMELDKGLAEYQAAIQLDPELAEAYFGLGVIHLQSGRKEEAIQAFERFQQYDQGQDATATRHAEQYLEQLRK